MINNKNKTNKMQINKETAQIKQKSEQRNNPNQTNNKNKNQKPNTSMTNRQ
jgi:hypothetical protein